MNFESAQEAANRLQVNVRTIQKWAKEGRIPGAKKVGRDWMIPLNVEQMNENAPIKEKKHVSSFLNCSFELGKASAIIQNIENEEERHLIEAEYYYYTGEREKATQIAESYLDSENSNYRYLAALICLFSNISLGRMKVANFAFDIIKNDLFEELMFDETDKEKAIGVFVASAASVLLHIPIEGKPLLSKYMIYLPEGLKAFSCYILSLKAYLDNNYQMSFGIAKTALNIYGNQYPLPAIYLNLMCAIAMMNLMKLEDAEQFLMQAYQLAEKDQFIEVFGEHYGMTHAYMERLFKKDHPDVYMKIIQIAKSFGSGWLSMHNKQTNNTLTKELTPLEFTIAMLYNRNWKIKEISYHMNISERTLKNYLSVIYEKLGISSRKELREYLIR